MVGYGGSIPAMLDALDRVGDVGEALRPWRDTLSGRERTILLKEQRDWRRAMQIFRWFLHHNHADEDLNVIHYNVVLCAVGRARRWDLVAGLWRQMRARGVAPDNATYGTLGALIGFMVWIWISVIIIIVGAEINAELEHQTRKDSTTGPPRPMGERGAYVADTVGKTAD